MENIKDFKKDLKILLVEDEYYTQEKLVKILNKVYSHISVANNGEEALLLYRDSYLNNKPYDLIISDIDMPKMNGIELLENIRQLDELLPFIFITAQLELDLLLKVVKLDIDDYIMKPIEIIPLLESIDRTFRKKFKKNFLTSQKECIILNSDLHWNISEKALYKEDKFIKLTKKEIQLLDLLCGDINKTVNVERIIYSLWEDSLNMEACVSSLKNLVSRIRIKIPSLNIENVYGFGYRIRSGHE